MSAINEEAALQLQQLQRNGSGSGSVEENSPEKDDSPARAPPRKRRRIVISCTECHRRKQKCDRKLPCTNCESRNKQDSCRYETGAPTAKEQRGSTSSNGDIPPGSKRGPDDTIPRKVANFGYSATGASTLGFLKKIDGANPDEPLSRLAIGSSEQDDAFGARERYKSLIRQLPARTYVEKLVDMYFEHFNWQYYGLEQDVFMAQLEEWNSLPFNLLNTAGPQGLSADLRAFPALLFQVIASALMALPPGPDEFFDSLKYAGTMSWDDLATDYSESGVAVLSLLGKRQISLTTVLAGFLRSAFLKYSGLVTEAWHAIGSSIRDAQELGIHKDSLDPKPKGDDAEAVLENQWEIQRRRKVWMILMGWDLHTGIVLGRPTTIDRSINYTLPVDAPLPKDRRKTPVLPRAEHDPPTPLTRALWSYESMKPLSSILDLEKEGPMPKNFTRVDKIHEELVELDSRTPPYFRLENPDTRFDDLPECYWIPQVRGSLPQLMSFNYMALHRPYIFTRAQSRTEALKASIKMLEYQKEHFLSLNPQQYKTFSLFFGTFDAIVLMATIFILFPKEHPELVSKALQHYQWSVQRFEVMSERNTLAKAALGVLQAIYVRLKKSLGIGFVCANKPSQQAVPPSNGTPASASANSELAASPQVDGSATSLGGSISGTSTSTFTPTTATSSGASDMFSMPTSASGTTDLSATIAGNGFGESGLGDLSLPPDFDWSSIQPIYAMADVVYNDLNGVSDGGVSGPSWAASTPVMQNIENQPWQFEGEFGDDSVWNLFNQYNPF